MRQAIPPGLINVSHCAALRDNDDIDTDALELVAQSSVSHIVCPYNLHEV